jgi:surface antigen
MKALLSVLKALAVMVLAAWGAALAASAFLPYKSGYEAVGGGVFLLLGAAFLYWAGRRARTNRLILLTSTALILCGLAPIGYAVLTRINPNFQHSVGEPIDELNGVSIYFNGGVNTTSGRNVSEDGYNLGILYQCVEFVKRYYFVRYGHRMPDSYGHARDFFDPSLGDGAWNTRRSMFQYANGSAEKPEPEDLIVFGPWIFNPYGHVAIVASIGSRSLQIAQQNPGPFGRSREDFPIVYRDGKWFAEHRRVLGWLRLAPSSRSTVAAPTTDR